MKNKYSKSAGGFTIVELLVVIVTIAILAAISIVAYVGIQERATNAARVAAAKQAITLMRMYNAAHGAFPEIPVLPHTTVAVTCLGEGWPQANDGRSVCWDVMDDGSYAESTFVRQDSVNDALAEQGALPSYPQKPIWSGVSDENGKPMKLNGMILYYREDEMRNSNGVLYQEAGYSVSYTMPANAECGIGGAIKSTIYPGGEESTGVARCAVLIE